MSVLPRWPDSSAGRVAVSTIAIIVLGTGAWLVTGLVRKKPELQVSTAPVTTGPIVRRIFATGALQAVTSVEIGSQVSGNIKELDADYNSIVRKDQVLARIDPSLFQAQLEQSKANLAQARANLAKAQSDRDAARVQLVDAQQQDQRAHALMDSHIEIQSDLDAADIAVRSAQAGVASGESNIKQAAAAVVEAEASVQQNQVNVEHCIIRAPIDGIIIQRAVDVGQTVAASMQSPTLFVLAADLTKMQVAVDVDESDIAGIQPGEVATFEVEAYPDETFDGTVGQVRLQPTAQSTATAAGASTTPAAALGGTVVSYTTIVNVQNPDERLRPGMTATVSLGGTRRDNAVRIPNGALSFRPSPAILEAIGETPDVPPAEVVAPGAAKPRSVWTYDGKWFKQIELQTGLADSQWTEVLDGRVHAGDLLVTNATLGPPKR